MDFPRGPVVKNLPANAGDKSSILGMGRFHMPQSNWAHRPQALKPTPPKPGSAPGEAPQWEAHSSQLESGLCSLELVKARMQQQILRAAKPKQTICLENYPVHNGPYMDRLQFIIYHLTIPLL